MIRRRGRLEGDLLWFDDKAYDLSRYAEVVLIGVGKASLIMGHAVESLLGRHLTRGVLVTNRRAPLPGRDVAEALAGEKRRQAL